MHVGHVSIQTTIRFNFILELFSGHEDNQLEFMQT
jgi:hypothetical protein